VYLYDLVVRPEHRRRGIGAGLIAELQRCCRSDNVSRIWAGTSLENRAAQRTFEASGAQRVSDTYAEYVYDFGGGPARRPANRRMEPTRAMKSGWLGGST
jgi:ribosomal protein S18 acetylase RimI-like enzyme